MLEKGQVYRCKSSIYTIFARCKDVMHEGSFETTLTVRGGVRGGGYWLRTPWTSEIYRFQGVFRPQWVISPSWKEKKCKPPLDKFLTTPLLTVPFSVDFLFQKYIQS